MDTIKDSELHAHRALDRVRTLAQRAPLTLALGLFLVGCPAEQAGSGAPSATASAAIQAHSAATAATPSATAPPTASAAAAKPTHDCPEGSSGDGTLNKPCEAKGTARLMEVTWTGKLTDTGPSFRVTNKAKLDILYGGLVAYFYDKSGKQLEVKDASGKTHPTQVCSGKIFDGVMKAGEKAVLTFSCVKKEHVPEGTAQVEAELQMVGFADGSGKSIDGYWKNPDIAPDTRPKGGVKK